MATLVMHGVPPSHPCATVEAALKLKGLDYERVDFALDQTRFTAMEEIYGEGKTRVPGLMVDDEPVHGSRPILARLEELSPGSPPLYPSDAVREAERWGDDEFQDLGRRLPWGALHFRPEAMGILGGGGMLDPAGTDFAIGFVRAGWKYHKISAVRLAEDLAGLPAKLDHIDGLIADGLLCGEQPNAADLQIGTTLQVLGFIGDLGPLLADRPLQALVTADWLPHRNGQIPAGAYPAGWV